MKMVRGFELGTAIVCFMLANYFIHIPYKVATCAGFFASIAGIITMWLAFKQNED